MSIVFGSVRDVPEAAVVQRFCPFVCKWFLYRLETEAPSIFLEDRQGESSKGGIGNLSQLRRVSLIYGPCPTRLV